MSFLDNLNLFGRVSALETGLAEIKDDVKGLQMDVRDIRSSIKMSQRVFFASQVPVWIMLYASMNK